MVIAYHVALKKATRSMKLDDVYVHLNVDLSLMSVVDVCAQQIMATRLHRSVNVFKSQEHQAVPVMTNVPISNTVILNEEFALTCAQRKCAVSMHYVIQQTIMQFVNVSPAMKEIQRFNAVSLIFFILNFAFNFKFLLNQKFYFFTDHTDRTRVDKFAVDMRVQCLAEGVNTEIHLSDGGFNGVIYVKGFSKEEECRKVINDAEAGTVPFKVHFGSCGLIHTNGVASFVLVIQKHPKLVTYKAQAYHVRCVYQTGEQNVTLGFNVSMLTTAGTIANTGPPPICLMRIVTQNGQEINSAEIGDNLMLQVDVQPQSKLMICIFIAFSIKT